MSSDADILYYTRKDSTTPVPLNPNDFNRFLQGTFPGAVLNYVKINNAPYYGHIYYNFYRVRPYDPPAQLITFDNAKDFSFYFNPKRNGEYALSELCYFPVSNINTCVTIPFTAYAVDGRSVSGQVLISSTQNLLPDIYNPALPNQYWNFPAEQIKTTVARATGVVPAGIQLLQLPDPSVGTLFMANMPVADTNIKYYFKGSGSGYCVDQLRFIPALNYTGPVEIPYAAYTINGERYAAGKLTLGYVNKLHTFRDVTPSTWCYKYIVELTDANIIDGYSDNTFREKNPLSYGAALKLVMRAAGYAPQKPTVKNSPFSGYLAKAQQDGLVTGVVHLAAPITRLELARLAAKALHLDIYNLSSVNPFTDTNDPYVQALNAAGIVEGYFDKGINTFRPNGLLTRGHITAIVWRMMQYTK